MTPEPAEVRTSPKNSARRPQQRTMILRAAISAIAAEDDRMSVRQLFYQLVSRGVIDKTEQAYKRVCDASAQMRLDGSLDYRKIADGHRSRRVTFTASGLQNALEMAHDLYRRNYWIDQPRTVEVRCEKDTLTGVIQPVCDRYGVTYVATRGFPVAAWQRVAEIEQLERQTLASITQLNWEPGSIYTLREDGAA